MAGRFNVTKKKVYWGLAATGLYCLLYPFVWEWVLGRPTGWLYLHSYLWILAAWFAVTIAVLGIEKYGSVVKGNNA